MKKAKKYITISILLIGILGLTGCFNTPGLKPQTKCNYTSFIDENNKLIEENQDLNNNLISQEGKTRAINKSYNRIYGEFVELKTIKLDTTKTILIENTTQYCLPYIAAIKRLERQRNESYWINITDNYGNCSIKLRNCTNIIEKVREDIN